jgi:pilus assembly protein Flp/PilA
MSLLTSLYSLIASFLVHAGARLRKEDGATAVEYGLIVALIAAVIIVAVTALGVRIGDVFCDVVVRIGGTCN